MLENLETYYLTFLVIGEKGSGKTCLMDRVFYDMYNPNGRPMLDRRVKTVKREDTEVKCNVWEDQGDPYNWGKSLRSTQGVLLTVDMTDQDGLTKARKWIGEVERYAREGTPIIIIGTKSDDADKQKITKNDLEQFVTSHSKASIFGPCITSAKHGIGTNADTLFTFASGVVIQNDPALKSQIASQSDSIKNEILPELEAYTSGFNKFVAYLKAIFSLGRFTLGVAKQNKAEELKAKLKEPDADVRQLVEEYKQENAKLVSDEIEYSNLFVKPYIKNQPSSKDVKLNEGDLGEILNKYSSPSKK